MPIQLPSDMLNFGPENAAFDCQSLLSSTSDYCETVRVLDTSGASDASFTATASDSDSSASIPLSQMSPLPIKRQKRPLFVSKIPVLISYNYFNANKACVFF